MNRTISWRITPKSHQSISKSPILYLLRHFTVYVVNLWLISSEYEKKARLVNTFFDEKHCRHRVVSDLSWSHKVTSSEMSLVGSSNCIIARGTVFVCSWQECRIRQWTRWTAAGVEFTLANSTRIHLLCTIRHNNCHVFPISRQFDCWWDVCRTNLVVGYTGQERTCSEECPIIYRAHPSRLLFGCCWNTQCAPYFVRLDGWHYLFVANGYACETICMFYKTFKLCRLYLTVGV